MEELFFDWFGLVLVGKGQYLILLFECYVECMGLVDGSVQILFSWWCSLLYFVVLVNGVVFYVVEQDDLYNSLVLYFVVVVFFVVLVVVQDFGCSGVELIFVVVVGYEVGICIGEFFGCFYYWVFYIIVMVGIFVVVVVVGKLMDFDCECFVDLFGSVGIQVVGFWEFFCDVVDFKQLYIVKVVVDGLFVVYFIVDGLSGV